MPLDDKFGAVQNDIQFAVMM